MKSDSPPSYEESTQATSDRPSIRLPVTDPLHATFLRSILDDEIDPRIQAPPYSTRLTPATLVLVPSNVASLQVSGARDSKSARQGNQQPKLVGFPSSEEPQLVYLTEAEHSLEFWSRPAATTELTALIWHHLQQQGYAVVSPDPQQGGKGTRAADWRTRTAKSLKEREASVEVEFKTVCIRLENEIGLFEARNGKAVIVRMDFGE